LRIGILGSGDVGQTLGSGFAAVGHEVMLGSRSPASERAVAWRERVGGTARTGSFAETGEFGEVAILATLWGGTQNALELAGATCLGGKVVLDVTNPFVFEPNQPPGLALGHTDSGGEQVQRWLPSARVVKSLNTVGYAHMVQPAFPEGRPDAFMCGNELLAKDVITDLLGQIGWDPIDIGGIEGARLLEPLAALHFTYAIRTGGWNHAFRLLRK